MKTGSDYAGQIKLEPSAFLPAILDSAKCFAEMLYPESEGEYALSVHPSRAAVKLRARAIAAEEDEAYLHRAFEAFGASDGSQYDGIAVFSGLVFEKRTLLMVIGDEFLFAFARSAAADYSFSLPEHIMIPICGAAPGAEASAYARSRLYSGARAAKAAHYPQANGALFRCLCLFCADALDLSSAHASAVRAALAACELGALGKVDSAAMAAALLYAENPQMK